MHLKATSYVVLLLLLAGESCTALMAYGVPPGHSPRMAAVFAADLLGVEDRSSVDAGKRADIIAMDVNPRDDAGVMEDMRFARRGVVVHKAGC